MFKPPRRRDPPVPGALGRVLSRRPAYGRWEHRVRRHLHANATAAFGPRRPARRPRAVAPQPRHAWTTARKVVGLRLSVARRHRRYIGSPQSRMMVNACRTTSLPVIKPLMGAVSVSPRVTLSDAATPAIVPRFRQS